MGSFVTWNKEVVEFAFPALYFHLIGSEIRLEETSFSYCTFKMKWNLISEKLIRLSLPEILQNGYENWLKILIRSLTLRYSVGQVPVIPRLDLPPGMLIELTVAIMYQRPYRVKIDFDRWKRHHTLKQRFHYITWKKLKRFLKTVIHS